MYKIEGKEADVIKQLITAVQQAQQQLTHSLGFIATREGLSNVYYDADSMTFLDKVEEKK